MKAVTSSPVIDSPSFFIGKGGGNIISFGSGQPDLPPPPEVYKILPHYKDFKYGLIQGMEVLREALAEQYPEAQKDGFVITNGASEALDLVLRIWLKGSILFYFPSPTIIPTLLTLSLLASRSNITNLKTEKLT